jgi:hypothetical protein
MGGEKWEHDQMWVTEDVPFLAFKAIQFKGRLYPKLSYKCVNYNKISKFVKNVSSSSKWLSVFVTLCANVFFFKIQ